MRGQFDWARTRCHPVLNALLDRREAMVHPPMLVGRLRRLRDARAGQRSVASTPSAELACGPPLGCCPWTARPRCRRLRSEWVGPGTLPWRRSSEAVRGVDILPDQAKVRSHEQAKRVANEHLAAEGSTLVAMRARRHRRYGVWLVDYVDPAAPDELLVGGALVVTDARAVHDVGSAPGSLDDLMLALGLWPGADPADVFGTGDVPASDTDAESLVLLAEDEPQEAVELAAWAAARRPWPGVLDAERAEPYFGDLMRFVKGERARLAGEVYPAEGDMFAAFHLTPFERVKVVVLGQDPYPNPGQAMGLSFSVPTGVRLPTSLRNIHAAMREEDLTPARHGDLTGWARQGVLLLNAALTVPAGGAGKHLAVWRPFTDAVVRLLNERERPVVFVLWGAKGQRVLHRNLVDAERSVVAPHPAARGAAQTRFREAETFKQVNDLLRGFDVEPIEWGNT